MKSESVLKILIASLVVLIVIMIGYLYYRGQNNINFYLIGDVNYKLYKGDIYKEPGFVAVDNDNNDLSNLVVIDGEINNNIVGDYKLTYTLTDKNGKKKVLERIVTVIYKDAFSLNGDSNIYMLIGGNYKELGANAFFDNKDYTNDIEIESNVDVNNKGVYTVNYYIKEINKKITRNVYVNDFQEYFLINYDKNITNRDLELKINVDTTKVLKYELPNKEESDLKDNRYIVNANNNYEFIIYDYYGNKISRTITIDNIDKKAANITCESLIGLKQTKVSVSSDKKIIKYFYNNIESVNSNYTFNSKVDLVNVKVIDEVGNESQTVCTNKVYSENMEIHFIASGHYDDAILIRTSDKVILIDSGRYNCTKKVIPYLKQIGVKKIDAMIGSHLHNDHIAAQAVVLDNFEVLKVYYPDDIFTCASRGSCASEDQDYIVSALRKHGKTPIIVKPKTVLTIGEMELYFLAPNSITYNQNNNSFVFILKFRNNTFMFTGDAYSSLNDVNTLKQNANFMKIPLKVDMLKYPHHGNDNLTTSFLSAIKPKYVVVPNYNASSYPSANNVKKITDIGAKIYRQSDDGNIVLISDGNKITFDIKVSTSNYKR